jgi:phenylacetate-coenzyme A ligase PaaK-like adenylate-forming protein
MFRQWNHKIFEVNEENFEALALEVFNFQYENNPVYRDYLQALGISPLSVQSIEQIPFLPIRFFKSHEVKTSLFEPQSVFESSGTTGSIKSRHFVKDLSLYDDCLAKGFEFFYGSVKDWCVIALLPSYLERKNSSLVYMAEKLIQLSEHPQSGFYLNEYEQLFAVLNELENQQQKILLIGVTFALLDFAEKYSLPLKHTVVIETGGMKGRREEMVRQEVHDILKKSFSLNNIHSEYGMTELLSQAYSKGEGIFVCPPWMKVLVRDDEDPLSVQSLVVSRESLVGSSEFRIQSSEFRVGSSDQVNRLTTNDSRLTTFTGAINIIDLVNIYSCSFISTDDVGKLYPDRSFEVLGRMDGSDLRGCSLMVI